MASSDLWGRTVYDTEDRNLGTIDSIARTAGGPVRAIVRPALGHRRFVLVDLSAAFLREPALVVPAAAPSAEAAERAVVRQGELARGGSDRSRP